MRLTLLTVAPLILAVTGCEPPAHPGERVGTFQITGSLDDNLCGAAVPALDPIALSVELRDQSGRAIWVADDAPVQEGLRMPDGAYRFRYGTTVPVLAPGGGFRGCSLQQVELVEVRVSVAEDPGSPVAPTADADAGVADAEVALAIEGVSEVLFTPTIDSDCSPLLVVNGGPWADLPCTLTYSLFGEGVGPDATLPADP